MAFYDVIMYRNNIYLSHYVSGYIGFTKLYSSGCY